jgi:hypothetical protein
MEPLMSEAELRRILEHGLRTGKWSVFQFNKTCKKPILPSRDFLEECPQFLDMNYRDLSAFRTHHHRNNP